MAAQQITQGVPGQLKGGFERLDQPLLLPFVEIRGIAKGFQLRQRFAVITEALLPTDVLGHHRCCARTMHSG